MSKLFKLKDWVTLEGAAKWLTGAFDEEVTEADVLQLGLDGRLRLSVDFVNGASGLRVDKIIPIDEAPYKETVGLEGEPLRLYDGLKVYNARHEVESILVVGKELVHLEGLFDLPMIGGERLDVQHRMHQYIGGPEIEMVAMDGTFVEGRDGLKVQLQSYFSEDTYPGNSDDYYPSSGLPNDCLIVVRTAALEGFIAQVAEHSTIATPPIGEEAATWPWGAHETSLLRHLAAAARNWWVNFDPTDNTTAPTNEQVSEWLKARGVAKVMADKMATILRSDGLPTGPRT